MAEVVALNSDAISEVNKQQPISPVGLMLYLCCELVFSLKHKMQSLNPSAGPFITMQVLYKNELMYTALDTIKAILSIKIEESDNSRPADASTGLTDPSVSQRGEDQQLVVQLSQLLYVVKVLKGKKRKANELLTVKVDPGEDFKFGRCQRVLDLEREKRGKFVDLDGIKEVHAELSFKPQGALLYNKGAVRVNSESVATNLSQPHGPFPHDLLLDIVGTQGKETFRIGVGKPPTKEPETIPRDGKIRLVGSMMDIPDSLQSGQRHTEVLDSTVLDEFHQRKLGLKDSPVNDSALYQLDLILRRLLIRAVEAGTYCNFWGVEVTLLVVRDKFDEQTFFLPAYTVEDDPGCQFGVYTYIKPKSNDSEEQVYITFCQGAIPSARGEPIITFPASRQFDKLRFLKVPLPFPPPPSPPFFLFLSFSLLLQSLGLLWAVNICFLVLANFLRPNICTR
jgi:hypothetical protein